MASFANTGQLSFLMRIALLFAGSVIISQSQIPLQEVKDLQGSTAGKSSTAGPWPIPPAAVIATLAALGALLMIRQRRMGKQRRVMRRLYSLGEEMTAPRLPSENLAKLEAVLPKALGVTGVRLYLHDRDSKTLRRVRIEVSLDSIPILLDDPASSVEKAVAACFRNRTLLAIPDTGRSPFFQGETGTPVPRAVMFVPMFAQSDLMGVLEIHVTKMVKHFSHEEQAVAQHLANQVAIGMKLAEREFIRERLFRNEKLAATGQFIFGVAAELKTPIEAITNCANRILGHCSGTPAKDDVQRILSEAQKASEITSRLVSLARAEQDEPAAADVCRLLRDLLARRREKCKDSRIQFRDLFPSETILVEGSGGRLRQVFSSLLVHAERSAASAPEQNITIRAIRMGGSVEVDITYGGVCLEQTSESQDEEDVLDLKACRSILRSHGGDLRLVSDPVQGSKFEIQLRPATGVEETTAGHKTSLTFTTLLVEPESAERFKLLTLLAGSGHRAIPASNIEEAVELATRVHFHILFCSAGLSTANWLEFYDKIRDRVDAVVLITEAYAAEASGTFRDGQSYMLRKPVEAEDLARLLGLIQSRVKAAAR